MCGCSTRQPVEAWQKNVDSIFEVVTNGDTFFFFRRDISTRRLSHFR
jgi:hypothetical protein